MTFDSIQGFRERVIKRIWTHTLQLPCVFRQSSPKRLQLLIVQFQTDTSLRLCGRGWPIDDGDVWSTGCEIMANLHLWPLELSTPT